MAGFIGVSNLIERDGQVVTVRPEKISMLRDGQADPGGAHVEAGRIREVIYAGVLTRYVVDLDAGGELVGALQNTEAPVRPGDVVGAQVRLAWQPDRAFAVSAAQQQDPVPGRG